MRLLASACVLTLASATALADGRSAMSVDEEAQALIGMEYTLRAQGQRIAPHLSCTSEGGGVLDVKGVVYDDWAFGTIKCRGSTVVALKHMVGKAGGDTSWRIVDTLVLPHYERDYDPGRLNALRLFAAGDCELDGRTDTFFMALVRWGKHDRIDWRTGIERAWTFDIERGRIVPLSTKRIVCYRPEPA